MSRQQSSAYISSTTSRKASNCYISAVTDKDIINTYTAYMAASSHDGLLNVGEHCAYSGCHRRDFLPFTCPDCESNYCTDHRFPSSHNCTAPKKSKQSQAFASNATQRQQPQRLGSSERPQNCSSQGCTTTINTALSPATQCPSCKQLTCLKHRLNHACPGPAKPTAAPKTALAKLAEWKAKQQAKASVPVTSEKEASSILPSLFKSKARISSSAAIVARAKDVAALKQSAKGDATVQPNNRVYVFVESDFARSTSPTPGSNAKHSRVEMFFGKDYPIGKVLDKSAQRLQIANHNNSSTEDKDRLRLYHIQTGRVLEFSEKLGGTGVKDGDTLAVIKGLILPNLLL